MRQLVLRVASTLLVVLGSRASADTLQVPGDFATIQDGIDAAVDGDTVLVACGDYIVAEPIVFRGKAITVRSAEGPEVTTVRMSLQPTLARRESVFVFEEGETEDTVLQGFTITGRRGIYTLVEFELLETPTNAYAGGGIFCDSYTGPHIEGNILRDNTLSDYGAGIFCNVDSRPVLRGNEFVNNRTRFTLGRSRLSRGGGVACLGDSVIVIEGGSFRDCEAVVGGAIFFAADSVAEVRGVRFEDNYAEFHGGAIFSRGTGLSVSDCTFLRNRSEGNSVEGFGGGGGAIEVDAFSHVNFRMENCHLEGNCARQGGGLSIENIQESGNSQAVVSGCVFISNRATVAGGGVYAEHQSDRVELRDCRFERNSALKGGGLYCSYGGETEVHGSVFHGNYAVHGGGVCCEESSTGLFNSTIVGNAAGNSGGGVYVISDDSRLTLTSSILWGNAGGSLRGDICAPGNVCSVTYCCIEDSMVWPGDGNINSSPLFAAWGEAGEVWVDAASPGPGNGSEADAYQSLKQALSGFSVALASSSPCLGGGQGGTNMGAEGEVVEGSGAPTRLVHLATGTYEFLDFTLTHTVSIEGRGPSETTLVGSVIGLRTGAALSRLSVTGAPSWGGVVVAEGESPAIRQVRISGNASSRDEENPLQGGGLYCYGSSPTVTNCLIAGNWSGSGGGAVYCREGAAPAVTNCTVAANGGSGVCSTNASPVLLNSIVSNHAAGSIVADAGSFPQVTYSLIEGDAVWPGEGNVSSAPLFVRDGVFDLEHFLPPEGDLCAVSPPDFIVDPGDYHLQEASPAIDAGTVDGAPAADIDGDQRPCGAAVDMGADETGDCVGFRFVRGDCNDDGEVNIADAVCILNWLFAGEATPGCVAATNANGDDAANITDATYLLNHLFTGGPAPVAPFPECGPGTLPADPVLGCANPPNCQ